MITKGSQDVSVAIRAISSAQVGVALTASSPGLSLWFMREGSTPVVFTAVDLASADADHVNYGIIHLGDGWHRLCLPDEAAAEGAADWVLVGGGATGCIIISSKEDLSSTASAVTTTTTTSGTDSEGLPNLANLLAAPLFTRTDEGAVRERTVDELIKADAHLKGIEAGAEVPWGLRIAKTKPSGTVNDY